MNRMRWIIWGAIVGVCSPVQADPIVSFADPTRDDDGPGTYQYPTDAVYKPGSFDMTSFEVETKGSDVIFRVGFRAKIEDPWNSKAWQGNGFSLQFVQVYVDQDHLPKSGACEGLPGLNVRFKPESCYEKVVLLSPQGRGRLQAEVDQKAGALAARVVIPEVTRVRGKAIEAVVDAKDLGGPPQKGWGYQVVVQSNEGYPDAKDLLTRKVNEYAGPHRFGGGSDWDCDPHVIDILVAPAKGTDAEVKGQHDALKYQCAPAKPEASPLVELPMVYT